MSLDSDHFLADHSHRALRACLISHQYPPGIIGGIGRFTADLAAGFAALGHDVHVLTTQGGICITTLEHGAWIHRLPRNPVIPEAIRSQYAGPYLARMGVIYREIARLHEEKPFDVVSGPIWLAEGLLAAMDCRFVSILSLHTSSKTGLDPQVQGQPARNDPLTELEMRCVGAYAYTHANSHAAVSRIAREYGPPNGVFVIPHGVNDAYRLQSRTRHDNRRIRVLLVGLLDKRKGADVLFRIVPEILSRFPTIDFALLGQASPLPEFQGETLPVAMKRRLVHDPDMLDRVSFAGVVSEQDLHQHYADADLLLLPSRYESFGLAVIEAMSFSLPVVAWKAGGVCETLVDGETGILVDLENEGGLVEAVGRLATDPGLRKAYGEAGRRRYLQHFSTAISIPRTIAAYREVVRVAGSASGDRVSFDPDVFASNVAGVIAATTTAIGEAALQTAHALITGDGADRPLVDVIVRCADSGKQAVPALNSVLAQTYSNFRCLVVDDGSSDNSSDRIAQWLGEKQDSRFSFVRNEGSQGWMACIAAGRNMRSGAFVAFLDASDVWSPEFLETHVGVSFSVPVDLSCSDRVAIGPDRESIGCNDCPEGGDAWEFAVGRNVSSSSLPEVRSVPAAYLRSVPSRVRSCLMVRRSLLDALTPSGYENFRTCGPEHFLALCHYLTGSIVIGRALTACRCSSGGHLSPVAVIGSDAAKYLASDQSDDDIAVTRGLVRHVLDYPPGLAGLLTARGRQLLLRRLVRRCLLAGIGVEDSRIFGVLGFARVLRDQLRAKVWFLRGRLK